MSNIESSHIPPPYYYPYNIQNQPQPKVTLQQVSIPQASVQSGPANIENAYPPPQTQQEYPEGSYGSSVDQHLKPQFYSPLVNLPNTRPM